jgi:FMN hydrolase / 5-amino-6-(5-phospho-D-ribitylamino)uracil phosphatase
MPEVPTKPVPISPPPRLIIFDLDDTLCDYASARIVRLRTAFSLALDATQSAQALDLDDLIAQSLAIHPHGTEHFPDLFRRNGIDAEGAAEIASEWYRTNRFHSLALFADAVETLDAVRRLRPARTIGMITNGPTEVQRAKIELLDVERHVDFLLISEEFGAWKPDPSIFVEALRLGNASADETIFIGDSPEHDIAGAQAAAIRSIWMNRTGRNWPAEVSPPDYEARDLSEVRALLDSP